MEKVASATFFSFLLLTCSVGQGQGRQGGGFQVGPAGSGGEARARVLLAERARERGEARLGLEARVS